MSDARVIPFGTSFIPALAREMVASCAGNDFSKTLVVFPGRRPALFLRREIARIVGGAFVPPVVLSMDAWMNECAGADADAGSVHALDAAYAIYTLAKKHAPEVLAKYPSFAAFLPWAREIFDIFEQAETELVPDERFARLTAHAELGLALPLHVEQLMARLGKLKTALYASFAERGIQTPGMRYRRAAEATQFVQYDRVIIANPSYLAAAEEMVVKAYLADGRAELWTHGSADDHPVIKKLGERLGLDLSGPHGASAPSVALYKAVGIQGQAVIARDRLKDIADPERTLVLLPSADSAVPVLSEISAVIPEMNVSLGYPVTRSALYALCAALFELITSCRGESWYAKDYLAVITHPLVKNMAYAQHRDAQALTRIAAHAVESALTDMRSIDNDGSVLAGSAFITRAQIERDPAVQKALERAASGYGVAGDLLRDIVRQLHDEIIAPWLGIEDLAGLADALRSTVQVLARRGTLKSYAVNEKCAEAMLAFAEIAAVCACAKERFDADALRSVFDETLSRTVSPFKGSPLKGLQVLGGMESRTLDFDDIIVLDANEGVLPSLRRDHPLIPADALMQLGLRRVAEDEHAQAYAFDRLCSCAKRVHLIYDDDDQKRRSRFVERLVWQREKDALAVGVMPVASVRFRSDPDARLPAVAKSPAVVAHLAAMTFTPSMLDSYVRCPLCFYYRSVLKLREKEELGDEPDSRAIGTLLHGFLEEAFRPLVGVPFLADTAFEEHFWARFEIDFVVQVRRRCQSASFLIERVAREKMRRFLAHERNRGVKTILALEHDLKGTIMTDVGEVEVFGRADRIEFLDDGQLMVVDYKSGASDPCKANADFSTRQGIKESKLKMQLPLYAYLAAKEFSASYPNACLYDLRNAEIATTLFKEQPQDFDAAIRPYFGALAMLVREIRDPSIPFVKDDEYEHRCI